MRESGTVRLTTPLRKEDAVSLRAGDRVVLSGVLYTARDTAHKRLVEMLERGEPLPMDLEGQVIYFAGPSPTRPGEATGSIGPTTSYRMDPYSPRLIAAGLRGMIGKGSRSKAVREALQKFGAVYLGATGGAGALLARAVRKVEVIAFEDLGPEAVRRLEVAEFPAVVINDAHGGDLYEQGQGLFRRAGSGA
ncbi:MAG: Fe-S-containing hydro-lyase [bacterium]